MDDVTSSETGVPVRQRLAMTKTLLRDLASVDLDLDLIVPDRESSALGESAADFVAIGGGLRVLLKLAWDHGQDPADQLAMEDDLLATARELLVVSPDADAVLVISPPSPFPCFAVDAYGAAASLAAPSGSVHSMPLPVPFQSTREALRQLMAPPEIDWSGLPASPVVEAAGSLHELVDVAGVAEVQATEVRTRGQRAHGDAKRYAWQQTSAADAEWATQVVQRTLLGDFDASALSAELERQANLGEFE